MKKSCAASKRPPGQLEVRAGTTRIRDIGTRFAVSLRDGHGQVAVAQVHGLKLERLDERHYRLRKH